MPDFFDGLKNWLFGKDGGQIDLEEFQRIESKHNRIRHDQDIEERIEVE